MTNKLASKFNPIKIQINLKSKETKPSNTTIVTPMVGAYQNDWSKKVEVETMTNDYLNEKLTYFYNNGGPIMDI